MVCTAFVLLQFSRIWVDETAVAVRPLGAVGTGGLGVVTDATLLYGESPPSLWRRTRYA